MLGSSHALSKNELFLKKKKAKDIYRYFLERYSFDNVG